MFVGPSPRVTNVTEVHQFASIHHDTYPLISPEDINLSGRSVFIAGASKGIGKTTAIRYAAAGCSKIILGARSSLVELETAVRAAAVQAGRLEPDVLSLSLDVSSDASVQAAAAAIDKFSGSLDVLIANAGSSDNWVPIAETNPAGWWQTIDTSLNGLYLCTRHLIPLLLKSDLKMIVALSSIGAVNVTPGASAYQTAKLATCRFVEFIDQEYHTQGIVAIALHPGGVRTELGLTMPEAFHSYLVDTPELPADHMAWLAKERREWLSGRFITSNWDVGELEAKKNEIVEKNLLKFKLDLGS
ncbi:hypothetical protein B0H67DRAFT_595465 [Lasiosphaeris hirsuta]|uniref:Oxidoreductase n=1 Tax=Lasiosphaeris hirsuta TaxID=260670 RepID=A0AA39ZRE7_9PEZI|nr:hypothetical protein B0H67DRAFT_595465 [Lasiosphaeris hirsuta]